MAAKQVRAQKFKLEAVRQVCAEQAQSRRTVATS